MQTFWRRNNFTNSKAQIQILTFTCKEMSSNTCTPRMKKQENRQKLSQAKTPEKVQKLRKERNRLNNCIKKRIRYLETTEMLKNANEIMQAKDNAQAALAIRKVLGRKKRKQKKITNVELTKHFSEQFWTEEPQKVANPGYLKLTTMSEVEKAKMKLKMVKPQGRVRSQAKRSKPQTRST